jgi:glycosyltransferase involved in cell wall biosynthesis
LSELVTIALPVYKRLDFLIPALRSADAQDYPNIELIVSDNGQNGSRVREMAEQHCRRPFRFRQNATTVPAVVHYNQLVEAASGKYFVMLCDDDEISANFVSELVGTLEQHPEAGLAIGRQEIIDGAGRVVRQSSDSVPATMTDEEFVHAWRRNDNQFECWVTNLARTADVRACGGYHASLRGTFCEDILTLRLFLGRSVAFNTRCTFRWRIADDNSFGWSMTCDELVNDVRLLLQLFDSDAKFLEFGRAYPARWASMKADLCEIVWTIFFWRWDSIYRYRLPRGEWCRAGFSMPWIPSYYRKAIPLIAVAGKDGLVAWMKKHTPWAIRAYRFLRPGAARSEA